MITISDCRDLSHKIRIIYNPLSELSMAMNLLCHPENQKLHFKTAESIRFRLSKKETEKLFYYENLIDGYLNLDRHYDYLNYPFDQDNSLDYCSEYISERDHWISSYPDEIMKEMSGFLIFFWKNYIKPIISEHLYVIEEQKKRGEEILKKKGLITLFALINERVCFTQKKDMEIQKWVNSSFACTDLNFFYIEMSLFSFPYLVISDRHKEGSFWISWDLPFRGDRIVAPGIDKISKIAFALSDKSRLRMIMLLSQNPMTQIEMTRLMGFAKSTINRHTRILQEAGLIKIDGNSERKVQLSLKKDVLDNFSKLINDWLN